MKIIRNEHNSIIEIQGSGKNGEPTKEELDFCLKLEQEKNQKEIDIHKIDCQKEKQRYDFC